MEHTLVFLDGGFLSKISKHFGNGKYLVYDIVKFAKNIAKKQNLECKRMYYYNAPPFQSANPTKEEETRKKKYDQFVEKLCESKEIILREGRCQRLKLSNYFVYKQKAVDSLVVIDLMSVPIQHPEIKKIILIASDSDFVPVIFKLKEENIKIILCTYYEKGREETFSTSNYLIKSVDKYVVLTKQDFEDAELK